MLATLWWCQLGASLVMPQSPPVQARSPPGMVPARCQLGPRQCRLGPRRCCLCHCQCLLGPRQRRLGAGSVPAGLDAGYVPSDAGSAATCVSSVPLHFMFTQIRYHRLPTDQSALTPQNSDCTQAMPTSDLTCASMRDPRAAYPKSQLAHHNDWMSIRRRPWIGSIESALSKVPYMQKQFRPLENENTIHKYNVKPTQ